MADNSFKINKSANFNPQAGLPANAVDGDFFYDATAQSFAYYHNGSWANFDSVGIVSAATDLTSAQFTPSIVRNSVVKVTGTGISTHIHGMSLSFTGKKLTLYNNTDQDIIIKYASATEPTANNRILTPTSGDLAIVAGEIAVFLYDVSQNRWLVVSISSNTAAQSPATISSNGIVTLHQASATPATPVVLSDGDINTVNGVVGLDANRAASITPSLGNTHALTLTGLGTGNGLICAAGASAGASAAIFSSAVYRGIQVQGGGAFPAIYATGGSSGGSGGFFRGGGAGLGLEVSGGVSGAAAALFLGTGNFAGIAVYADGAPDSGTTDVHLTYGVVAGIFQAGSAGGHGIVSTAVGSGYAGIRVLADTGGHGIIADAGAGPGTYAGIFNGDANISGDLTVSGTLDVAGITVGVGGITIAPGNITGLTISAPSSGNNNGLTTAGSGTGVGGQALGGGTTRTNWATQANGAGFLALAGVGGSPGIIGKAYSGTTLGSRGSPLSNNGVIGIGGNSGEGIYGVGGGSGGTGVGGEGGGTTGVGGWFTGATGGSGTIGLRGAGGGTNGIGGQFNATGTAAGAYGISAGVGGVGVKGFGQFASLGGWFLTDEPSGSDVVALQVDGGIDLSNSSVGTTIPNVLTKGAFAKAWGRLIIPTASGGPLVAGTAISISTNVMNISTATVQAGYIEIALTTGFSEPCFDVNLTLDTDLGSTQPPGQVGVKKITSTIYELRTYDRTGTALDWTSNPALNGATLCVTVFAGN